MELMVVVGRIQVVAVGRRLAVRRRFVVAVGRRLAVGRRGCCLFPVGADFSPSRRETVGINFHPARKVGVRYCGAANVSRISRYIVVLVLCVIVVYPLCPLSRMCVMVEVG